MQAETPELPRECAETRTLFAEAFLDPGVEEQIMLHAFSCLECMDAFLELKETVKQLETAATGIPKLDDFQSRVLEAIDREEVRRRRRFRTAAVGGLCFLAGIAMTLALTMQLPPRDGGETGAAGGAASQGPTQSEGAKAAGAGVETRQGAGGLEASAGGGEKAELPTEVELQPGDDPPPPSDDLGKILEAILAMEREPPAGPSGARGRRAMKLRSIMHRISLLPLADRAELVARLKNEPEPERFGPGRRFRSDIIERINSLPNKPLRDPVPPRRGQKGN